MRSSPKYAKTLSILLIACAAIFFFITTGHTADSPLIISEFRLRGPNGASDEFIEIYNNTDTAHTVTASDGSPGYGVFASDGVMRFFIPNGTVIPARGHYLGANSAGYSLDHVPCACGHRLSASAIVELSGGFVEWRRKRHRARTTLEQPLTQANGAHSIAAC